MLAILIDKETHVIRPIQMIWLLFAAALATGLAEPRPALAGDTASAASIDCSKADATMMMKPALSMSAIKSTGDPDRDFAHAMLVHDAAMTAMMKTEIACGKNAKLKAMAQKSLDRTAADDAFLRQIVGGGG
jgi:uncharacterized protein (DUF305 family)